MPLRSYILIQGRRVLVLKIARGGVDTFAALDMKCFHKGATLGKAGSLSVVDGHVCITCPLHHYRIGVESGRRFMHRDESENADDEDDSESSWEVKGDDNHPSKKKQKMPGWGVRTAQIGVQQRIHDVDVRNGVVFVRLRLGDPPNVASDQYAYSPSFNGKSLEW
jgi:nitrite reductase/ring-hydroxylating ferredoxin subunit